ncbi:ECF transporter S component, partial [Xanthomonas citri pv. citri]|nr:ECF transporter S component [Xanthomonas citri pv. citri]
MSRRQHVAVRTSATSRILLIITAIMGLLAFCWPLFLNPGGAADYETRTPFLFAAILPVVLAVVVSQLSSDGIDVKALAMIGVLTACGAALRTISPSMAGIS